MVTEFLDKLPIWGLLLLFLVTTFVAIDSGYRLGSRKRDRLTGEETFRIGTFVIASFSLLAFMVAIIFDAVAFRYSEIKQIALDEANAISDTFLRADLLTGADRAEIRQLLYEYVTLRIEATRSKNVQKIEEAIDKSEALQNAMWSRAVTLANQQSTPVPVLFVQSLNSVIDLHQTRVTIGIYYRMPGIIWITLFSLVIITLIMGGYDSGLSGNRRVITITLLSALSFSVVITLMVALDRPRQHLSEVTHKAMLDVQKDIRRSIQSEN
jgi:hypothetical protein